MENTQEQKTPEPIELRPEDLVSGEIYTLLTEYNEKHIFSYKNRSYEGNLNYTKMICLVPKCRHDNNYVLYKVGRKLVHATPEEKALLLGEEQTDWETKYNELKVENDSLKVGYKVLNEKFEELQAKYDQLEPKGEKVYFCNTHKGYQFGGLDWAVKNSREQESIYEAYCIGKKKSILVSE